MDVTSRYPINSQRTVFLQTIQRSSNSKHLNIHGHNNNRDVFTHGKARTTTREMPKFRALSPLRRMEAASQRRLQRPQHAQPLHGTSRLPQPFIMYLIKLPNLKLLPQLLENPHAQDDGAHTQQRQNTLCGARGAAAYAGLSSHTGVVFCEYWDADIVSDDGVCESWGAGSEEVGYCGGELSFVVLCWERVGNG